MICCCVVCMLVVLYLCMLSVQKMFNVHSKTAYSNKTRNDSALGGVPAVCVPSFVEKFGCVLLVMFPLSFR